MSISETNHKKPSKLVVSDCRNPWVFLATGFGSGFLPKAPGTWGTIVALPVWWFFIAPLEFWIQILVILVAAVAATWVVEQVLRRYPVGDAGEIVIDEIVGMWCALALLPANILVLAVAFALFRLFDIAKPGPVGWADRTLHNGLGVMMDDLIAGILSCGVLHFSLWILSTMQIWPAS